MTTLAAEHRCDPALFTTPGVHVIEAPAGGGDPARRRRYAVHPEHVTIVSGGTGAVVAATAALLPAVRALFAADDLDAVFDPQTLGAADALLRRRGLRLAGPWPRLLCGADTLREVPAPPGFDVTLEVRPSLGRIAELEAGPWPNAVATRRQAERPTQVLAIARDSRGVAGVGSAGADSDFVWQIGIDVRADVRGQGLAAALVAEVTRFVLDEDRVPLYSLSLWNVPSFRTASAVGYRLAFWEAVTYSAE